MTGDKNCGDVEGDEGFASPSADSEEYRTSDHNIVSNVTDGNELHPTRSRASALAVTQSIWRRTYETIYWTPERLRWDPDNAPKFSIGLNVLFGFAGAFTVANLYYNHPILNILARDFHVPYVKVADIPTLAQAGYACGLLFLCPLGDMFPRRPFVLTLVLFTATMSIGLAATRSLVVFCAIQFITALTTVTPQLMLPLVAELAPPHRRAAALSIVVSGLMLGILLARLLSGIMTQFVSWRYVYWLSVALQYLIFIGLWLFMPDYPATNKGLNYFKALWSIAQMIPRHPVLVQACLQAFFTSACFTNFWTVLTFLLAGAPYYYDPIKIGLFALIGIAIFLGMCWSIIGIALGTYIGSFTVAGPILQAFLLDFGMQTAQIANRSAIYAVEPKGRNRVNTAFMVSTFCGQLTGTSVGANLFSKGGWVASGSYSMGSIGMALLITFARGPWEEGWVGWHGGFSIFKKTKGSSDGKGKEAPNELRPTADSEDVDVEKAEGHHDHHAHRHGRDDQGEVNAEEAEKALELRAADGHDSGSDSRTGRDQVEPVAPQDTQA